MTQQQSNTKLLLQLQLRCKHKGKIDKKYKAFKCVNWLIAR